MANNEHIESLLSNIGELEKLVVAVRETEVCPDSFFNQSFDLAQTILNGLCEWEAVRLEALHRQMEEHRKQLQAVAVVSPPDPLPVPTPVASDFRKAFSLNDRFLFRRELFGGNEERMSKAIAALNELPSYEESIAYLREELKWDTDNEVVTAFITLLEKRFL
ncbi:hypothetical protein Barb7_00428 [Bacteroidales bacterium Barb7]|nr:hypothetical protein Barb7_00428 [Bacteroidales bacterium Barb7]